MLSLYKYLFGSTASYRRHMTARSLRSIYQLKLTLQGVNPPVWRRLQIASSENLASVHLALQLVMGWANTHLHEFVIQGERYGVPDADFPSDILNERAYRLEQVMKKENDKLHYVYDFGDSWEHELVLEKILPFATDIRLPVCLEGERACPPEDVGGAVGYEMCLQIIADPSHPEYEDMLEWVGEDFDPELFDVEQVNGLLRDYCD